MTGITPPRDSGAAAGEADSSEPIATIYTTPNCVQCVATKRAFEKMAEVPYAVVDVSTNSAARDMLADMGYRAAPVVITAAGDVGPSDLVTVTDAVTDLRVETTRPGSGA